MSPQEKTLVKQTWQRLTPMADAAARLFYDRLFEIDETARPLFETADMGEQRRKLVHTIAVVVQGLDHLEDLLPALADLGRRHVGYGVTDSHYESVGAALLWTLEQGLGSEWSSETNAAWSRAYLLLTGVMREAT